MTVFGAGLLGALVGSFLNVVIYRLPLMMEAEWRGECRRLFGTATDSAATAAGLGLVRPRSFCPGCRKPIPILLNIPLVSWLMLRGRCAACGIRIHWRYPLVELLTILLFGYTVWHWGLNSAAVAAAVFSAALLVLAVIDLEHRLLPDALTLPLLWLGLLYNLRGGFVDLHAAVLGAAFGYLALWLVLQLARLILRKEAMGYGDLKLLAALGAWLGWQLLPAVVFLASCTGAVVGLLLLATGRLQQGRPVSFGPYLALAGWLALYHAEWLLRIFPVP